MPSACTRRTTTLHALRFLDGFRIAPVAAAGAVAAAIATAGGTSRCAAQSWDGGATLPTDFNWTSANNWNPNGVPGNDGSAVVTFAGSNKPTPNVNVPYDLNSLIFAFGAADFTLGGQPLSIRNGGIHQQGSGFQTINNNVVLRGTQTWQTGGPLILNGGLSPFTSATLNVDGSSFCTFNGAITGSTTLRKLGGVTLTLAGATANTYTGDTTVGGGTVLLNKTAANGAIPGGLDIAGVGAQVFLQRAEQIADNKTVTIGGNASGLRLAGFNETIGSLTMAGGSVLGGGGTLTLTSGGINTTGPATFSSNLNLGGTSRTISTNPSSPSDALTLSGVISNGDLFKEGQGTLTLQGTTANTHGATLIKAGTLALQKPPGVPAVPGDVSLSPTVVDNAVLRLQQDEQIHNAATVTIDSGTFNLNTFDETVGALVMNGGSVTAGFLTVAGDVTCNATVDTPEIHFLAMHGDNINVGNDATLRVMTLTEGGFIKTGPGRLLIGGPAAGAFALAVVQDGTLVLADGNGLGGSSSGAAVGNTGTLELLGVFTPSALQLSAGGTLRGIGASIHGGNVMIDPGASVTIATGASPSDVLTMGDPFEARGITGGGAGATIHIAGSGTVNLDYDNGYSGNWAIDSGKLVASGGLRQGGSLSIASGAKAVVPATSPDTFNPPNTVPAGTNAAGSKVSSLAISGSGQLDLNNNDMVIDHDGSLDIADIRDLIASGYNFGGQDGPGIISTTAALTDPFTFTLGYADNASLPLPYGTTIGLGTLFAGFDPDDTAALIKFTWVGDVTLDGVFDFQDLSIFNGNYDAGATTGRVWTDGDLNYDGTIDFQDLSLFNGTYDPSKPSLPEPASLSLLAASGLLRRRRAGRALGSFCAGARARN